MNIEIPKRKRALLFHYAGAEVDEIFDTLPNNGDANDYDTAVERLNREFRSEFTANRGEKRKKENRWIAITLDFENSPKHVNLVTLIKKILSKPAVLIQVYSKIQKFSKNERLACRYRELI